MLGVSLEEVLAVVQKAPAYLDIAVSVLEDPALPTVANRIRTIRSMAQAKSAATPRPPGQAAPKVGIGLADVVKPLDYYIYAKQHPVTVRLMAGVAIAVPLVMGFVLGRVIGRRSKKAQSISGFGGSKTRRAGGRSRRRMTLRSSRR